MNRVLAFHQSNFLPNLSFFNKMQHSDVFVIASTLQYTRRDWQNRVLFPQGDKDQYLSFPVSGSNRQALKQAMIGQDNKWQKKHIGFLQHNYRKTPEKAFLQDLIGCIEQAHERLVDFNVQLIQLLIEAFSLPLEFVLDEQISGHKAEIVINLCQHYRANHYLSGAGGKLYMDDAYQQALQEAKIECRFIENQITRRFPYSSAHYLLTHGVSYCQDVILEPV